MAKQAKRVAPTRQDTWAGVLWGAIPLLLLATLGIVVASVLMHGQTSVDPDPYTPPVATYLLLWTAALTLLAVAVISLPTTQGITSLENLSPLPAVLRIPLTAGIAIGSGFATLIALFLVLTSMGAGSTTWFGDRFAMSIMALLGAAVSVPSAAMGLPGSKVLVAVWLVPIVIFLVRTLLGAFGALPRNWSEPA